MLSMSVYVYCPDEQISTGLQLRRHGSAATGLTLRRQAVLLLYESCADKVEQLVIVQPLEM